MTISSLPFSDPKSQISVERPRATHVLDGNPARQSDLSQRSAWQREMERSQVSTWFKPFEGGAETRSGGSPLQGRSFFTAALNNPVGIRKTLPVDTTTDTGPVPTTDVEALTKATADGAVTTACSQYLSGTLKLAVHPALSPSEIAPLQSMVGTGHSNTVLFNAVVTESPIGSGQISIDAGIGFSEERASAPSEEIALPRDVAFARSYTTPLAGVSTAELTAIRLHAQYTENTVQLWLGMDGTASHILNQTAVIVSELHRHFSSQGIWLGQVVCNGQVVFEQDAPSPTLSATFAQRLQAQSLVMQSVQGTPTPIDPSRQRETFTPYFSHFKYPRETP